MTRRELRRYLLVFAAGQVAGIVAASRHERRAFIASVRATIERLAR